MIKKLLIGSRESRLAVLQTEIIIEALKKELPDYTIEHKTFKTTGDKLLNQPLSKIGGKGLFVKELDRALLEGNIDIAVHSLKDLPRETAQGTKLAAFYKRGNPFDRLVINPDKYPSLSKDLFAFFEDHKSLTIGTSSGRRALQLKVLKKDIRFENIRGNIHTRLQKMKDLDYDGIVLASAGMIRAGITDYPYYDFTEDWMVPAAGQGTLVLQCRNDFPEKLLSPLNDPHTAIESLVERKFIQEMDADCTSPIGAYAKIRDGEIELRVFKGEDSWEELLLYEDIPPQGFWKRTAPLEEKEKISIDLAKEIKEREHHE